MTDMWEYIWLYMKQIVYVEANSVCMSVFADMRGV